MNKRHEARAVLSATAGQWTFFLEKWYFDTILEDGAEFSGGVLTPTSIEWQTPVLSGRLRIRPRVSATSLRDPLLVDEKILSAFGSVWRERSMFGPIEPLEFEGDGKVEIGPTGLRCKSVFLTTGSIHSTSIERADTLQVTTRGEMWQFRLSRGSAFRMRLAIDRWRGVAPPAKHRARQQSEDHFIHGGQRA